MSVSQSVLDGSLDVAGNGFIYSDYDPGGFGDVSVSDSVVTGYNVAVSIGAAAHLPYWQASTSALVDNIIFGNTTDFGPHIISEIGQSITGTDTNAPIIGSRGTYLMSDWAVGGGATAGFGASDAVTIGIRPGA